MSDTFQRKIGYYSLYSFLTRHWEWVAYGTLLLLAVITRLYGLGMRSMSHDESLHTLYSWNLYAGKGYQHDPLMHGPFLFHATALMYFLFGDSDFTARLSAALFGIVLVMLPYWFRPWLGKLGALAASVMLLMSPGILYYSRYIRNEAYVNVWTVLMVLALFQFMRTRRSRWLYIGAAAVSLMLATKEVAYIHGFIGLTFILLAWMWESISRSGHRRLAIGLASGMMILGVAIALLSILFAGGEEGVNFAAHLPGLMIKILGLLIGVMVVRLGVDRTNQPVTSVLLSLRQYLPDLIKATILAVVIFVVLHTTIFSNIKGLVSGTYGAISYWLAQQEVQRGSQPWYYYLFLIPMYEFLPVLVGGLGGLLYIIRGKFPAYADRSITAEERERPIWPSDGGTFAAFLIYWVLLSFSIYSWAGEKMPWLTVHMTLPFIFLAAHIIQAAFHRFEWREALRHKGLLLGGAILLLIPALSAIITARPFQGQSQQDIEETLQFITAIIILVGLGGLIWYYGRRMGRALAVRTALATGLLLLGLLTVRFSWMLNYINYDYVNEILVYAHASPDVKAALTQIEDISRRTEGDKMIRVAYDNDSTWPLEWYLREYPNRVYYGENPTRQALDAPIVIVGSANEEKVKPFLGNKYIRYRYRLVWWPMEDYKNQTLQKLWQNYVVGTEEGGRQAVRDNWRKLWKILFYRQYEDYKLNEWPFVHRFYVYVRKDVLNNIWEYQSGPVQLTQGMELDPYAEKQIELQAVDVWGSKGSEAGRLDSPRDVAVGPDGTIYVADTGNHRIQAFDETGNLLRQWGGEGSDYGSFNEPWGIAVGPEGTVYVADTWNHRVQAFSPHGEFLWTIGVFANFQEDPQAGPGKFWGPRDIAVDEEGNLYITDTGNKRIQKFTPDGDFIQMWGRGGPEPGQFEEPVGIDIDSQGNIYVADTWNRRIQKFDPDLNVVTEWDVLGWESESVVNKPFLAVDGEGRVVVSDPEGYRLIAYTDSGELLATWGQYGQDLASFSLPIGLDFNREGLLFVTDSDNNRIMKFLIPESFE